jgi:hypothetical protein
MRGRTVLCSLVLVLSFAGPGRAEEDASDAAPDIVVAVTGERIQCEVVSSEGAVVRVRIGARTYDFDRESLARVERAGAPTLEPDVTAFVKDLVARLDHPDAALARAAREGLRALGPSAAPYLDAAREAASARSASVLSEVRRDLVAEGARASGVQGAGAQGSGGGAAGSRTMDAMFARARALLELTAEQEKPFQAGLTAYVDALRTGGDAQAAEETLRSVLKGVLTDLQLATLRGWLGALRPGRGGGGGR